MNVLRAMFLALLVLALPMRGVMAMANLCPPAAGATGQAHAGPALASAAIGHADAHAHHAVESEPAEAPHHHDKAATSDTCSLCSACCSMPSLATAVPAVALVRDVGAAVFPRLSVPPADFVSDGQERPPRGI